MVADIPRIYSARSFFARIQLVLLVCPQIQRFKFATFSIYLSATIIMRLCPRSYSTGMNIHLISSSFTSTATSILASNKSSIYFIHSMYFSPD